MKKNITKATYPVNNVQSLASQPTIETELLKATFDKGDSDGKDFVNNTLITELESAISGDSGANKIGLNAINVNSDNVNDGIAEVQANVSGVVLGQIPDNSLTDIKLSQDVKIGSLATLNTTEKTSVTGAINEVEAETTQLDWQTATVVGREIQVSKPTALKSVKFQLENDIVAGTVISISTDGGVTSLPLKDILEVDILELEKGFYEVIANATFFTLRPQGKNPLGAWNNPTDKFLATTTGTTVLLGSVVGSGWIISASNFGANNKIRLVVDGVDFIGDASNAIILKTSGTNLMLIRFETGFSYYQEAINTTYRSMLAYVLGDDFEKSLPNILINAQARTCNTEIVNISGEGWFYGITSTGGSFDGIRINIDGVDLNSGQDMQNGVFLFKFNTNLSIFANGIQLDRFITWTLI